VRAAAASLGRGALIFAASAAVLVLGCAPAEEAPATHARAALRAPAALPPRSIAFVLVDMGGGVALTADEARGRLLDAPDSLRNHLLANSYGAQDVSGEVFGPLAYAFPSGCATATLAATLRGQIPGAFDHYLWYLGTRQDVCGWKGLAAVGTALRPERDTWLDALSSCLVMAQEPEHNFGVVHASSLACPHAPLVETPNVCASSEYGDPFDPMGGGCRHLNAYEKEYRGWFGPCNGVDVNVGGTYTVLPLERRCDGVQFLRIAAPHARSFNRPAGGGGPGSVDVLSHYYVELRTPRDFDGTFGGEAALAPQVLIRVGADRGVRSQGAAHTYLLDMTPETPTLEDAALAVGQTFVDPDGTVRITTRAVSAAGATIEVALDRVTFASACLDGKLFEAPGPGAESCEAELDVAGDAAASEVGSEEAGRADVAATDAMGPGDAELDAGSTADADAPGDLANAVVDARDEGEHAPVPRVLGASGPPFSRSGAGCGCATGAPVGGGPSPEGPLVFVLMGASVLRFRRWPMRPRR
jgi:MYXO-CTERM domain-containing protein